VLFATEIVKPTVVLIKVENSGEAKPAVAEALAGKPEDELKKKIEDLEAVEKIKIDEHRMGVEKENLVKEEEKKKETELFNSNSGVGKLPSYQELFKSTKQNNFKTEVVDKPEEQIKKPIFINKIEEVKIPQPPQLAKKPVPVFEEPKNQNPSGSAVAEPPPLDKGGQKVKMDYDALFGNDSDKN
jgi:hypothetical protein